MDEKKARDVAIFRYGIIAPVLYDEVAKQSEYFRNLATKQLSVPHRGFRKQFSAGSFKTWLRCYVKGGFQALMPATRSDKGSSKKIDEALSKKIQDKIKELPRLSASGIYRMMMKEGSFSVGDFTENTFRSFIHKHQLRKIGDEVQSRKKFEAPAINLLWVSDFMHGISIMDRNDHNRKKKTYLCAIIDDHSRMLMGYGFFFQENSVALMTVLKAAILQYGLCTKFYCDNGSVFSTQYLQEACARIGIALIHSRPYDSPSRGKIERFFRSVRLMFLSALVSQKINDLSDLNRLFQDWVVHEYHEKIHEGIHMTPKERYLKSLSHSSIKRLSETDLDHAFYHSIKRSVKKDSTVVIDKRIYEVPPEYIGDTVELRYPIDNQRKISLFEKGQPICELSPVNVIENYEKPYTGIHFSKEAL